MGIIIFAVIAVVAVANLLIAWSDRKKKRQEQAELRRDEIMKEDRSRARIR